MLPVCGRKGKVKFEMTQLVLILHVIVSEPNAPSRVVA